MNEKTISIIQTADGKYKRWTGKQWLLYGKTNCNECDKELFRSKQDLKRYKQFFCCEVCKKRHFQRISDPQSCNLLNDKSVNFYYLIGLIVTDGWVQRLLKHDYSGNGYRITIQLQKRDMKLLYDIKNFFGGIVSCIKTPYPKWTIYSFDFNEYLKNVVKITDDKSFTLNIDEWFVKLSDQNKAAFIRGVIDGDGCVYYDNRRGKHKGDHHLTITSASFMFIKTLFNYMENYHPSIAVYQSRGFGNCAQYKLTLRNKDGYEHQKNDYYVIRLCSKKVLNFLGELYDKLDDNLIYMERKRNSYLKIKEYYGSRYI